MKSNILRSHTQHTHTFIQQCNEQFILQINSSDELRCFTSFLEHDGNSHKHRHLSQSGIRSGGHILKI